MSSLANRPTLAHLPPHSQLDSVWCIAPIPTITMDFDMTAFLQNETCGFKKFEEVLTDDVYCTVPEALAQTYGVVCSPSLAMNEEGVPAVVPPVQVSDTVMFLTKVGYLKCMYIS